MPSFHSQWLVLVTDFTPLQSLLGGALIGFGAVVLWLGCGRVAGISGIVAGALSRDGLTAPWRWMFVAGLLLGAAVTARSMPELPAPAIDTSMPLLLVAGALVGLGTRLGSGCTSGHGVCGLARASQRSMVATCVFMAVAAVTVFIVRHVLGSGA